MKKITLITLTIILVATMMLGFVGCATATVQDQLRNIWRPYEKYVYSVIGNGEEGVYTVEIIRNTEKTVTIGDITLENVGEGYIINNTLEIGGKTHLASCYMQKTNGASLFMPIASYTKRPSGDYETVVSGKYEGKNFNYTVTEYGAPRDESITLKAPYYDNNQIHQLLRSVNSMSTLNFHFNVPIATEKELASLSATYSNNVDITWGADETITKCNEINLSRTTKVGGMSQVLYYSVDPIKVNGWELKNVLVRFKEPLGVDDFMVYTLVSISLEA